MRSVFSLYTETFTIAALEGSGIRKLNDILGKRVNFGPKGSGMYATMEMLLNILEWKKEDFSLAVFNSISLTYYFYYD